MSTTVSSEELRVVSRQEELEAAYQELKEGSGGTILLEATDTYSLRANDSDGSTDAAVTIRSADSEDPATITSVRLIGAENLTIEDVNFHMDGDDDSFDDIIMRVSNSENITIKNSVMTSDAKGPLGTDAGYTEGAMLALVRNSESVIFEGNQISGFSHGLSFNNSHDITVVDNDISALQGDGIRIAGVSGMLVEGNHLHDFHGSTQDANHSDMIQFWGINTSIATENITIRENFLDTGNGANYQMIFGYNNAVEQNGFTWSNILIEGNVLFGAHSNAIALQHTDNATVTNNTIIYNADTYEVVVDGSQLNVEHTNRIEVDGTNTLIENNISQRVVGGTDNALLTTSSPHLEDDYRAHFINVEAGGSGDLRDLMLRPDSDLNGTAGSWLTWSTDKAETLTAVVDVTVSENDNSVVTLNAGLSRGPDGYVAAQGAEFRWFFGDGSTATGQTVTHDFGTGGTHSYQLTVTMPDGAKDSIARTIDIDSAVTVNLSFEDNALTSNGPDAPNVLLYENAEISNGNLEIGGRDRLEISRDTPGLFNLNDFNIGVNVNATVGSSGTLLHLPRTFEAGIDANGYLQVSFATEDGLFEMTSSTAHFDDAGAHKLNFIYDGEAETLSLLVDGAVDTVIAASGITSDKEHWGLTLGARWGNSVDAQVSEFYVLTEAITREEAEATLAGTLEIGTALQAQEQPQEQPADLPYVLSSTDMNTPDGYDITKGTLTVPEDQAAIHAVDTFTVSFDMALGTAGTEGTLMYLHDMMELSRDDQGRLVFRLQTDEGWNQIASAPLDLNTGETHAIAVTYDAGQSTMQIQMDDAVVASGRHGGTTAEAEGRDLHLGHPWSEDVADALVRNITVETTSDLGPVAMAASADGAEQEGPEDPAEDPDTLVFLDFEGDRITDTSGHGVQVNSVGDAGISKDSDRGEQVAEIADASAIQISRDYDALYQLDNFMFNFDIRSDEADGRKVFGIHQSYQLDIVDNDFVFSLETDDGNFVLETNSDLLADKDWHNVEISYSDAAGQLQMAVDGETVASTTASGITQDREHWGLEMGFRWGDGFDGAIDKFALMTDIGTHHFDGT